MQTFLPLPDFRASARCLDDKRLGKQRVECKQILLCLGVPVGEHTPRQKGWMTHPAVLMWRGHELALVEYAIIICQEWAGRNFTDRLAPQFAAAGAALRAAGHDLTYPAWLGDPEFHASHRSNLLRKDFHYYSQFNWNNLIYIPYKWPEDTLSGHTLP